MFFLRRSKVLTRPANNATPEKIINACAANTTPKNKIVKLAPSFDTSTNCGRNAKKNSNTLGLRTFIKTPRLYNAFDATSLPVRVNEIFFPARAALNAPNAKNSRYAGPKIFSKSMAVAEDFINAATPTITSVVWKTMPLTSPHAKIIPAFAPSDRLLVSKYKMSGPGASVSKIDAVKKYTSVVVSNRDTSN